MPGSFPIVPPSGVTIDKSELIRTVLYPDPGKYELPDPENCNKCADLGKIYYRLWPEDLYEKRVEIKKNLAIVGDPYTKVKLAGM